MLRLALAYFILLIAAVKRNKKCPGVKLFFIKLLIVMQPCVITLRY